MPRHIVLLAGLHKTATSSIQQTCLANLDTLRAAGFGYFLTSDGRGGPLAANHTALLGTLFKDRPHRTGLAGEFHSEASLAQLQEARRKGMAAIERVLSRARSNHILAAEGVSLFSIGEMERMKAAFADLGWPLRVICHVRHLDSWMHSMIAQRVVSGPRLTIDRAVQEFAQAGSIVRRRIENLKSVFPDAEFFSHEAAVRHPLGPAAFFFDRIGVPLTPDLKLVRANEGSSDAAARLVSILNERYGRYLADGRLNPQRIDNDAITALRAIGAGKFKLTKAEVAPIASLLDADNAWLGERLGAQFMASRLEFSESPAPWDSGTRAQASAALSALPPEVRAWCESRLPAPRT